jgi:hypothetical protein
MPEYNPPSDALYTEISVPEYISPEKFIGRGGFHLKRITELSRCNYIWLDFQRLVVEVWGYEERHLTKAIRMLTKRINSFPVEGTPKIHAVNVETRGDTNTFVYDLSGKPSACIQEFERILNEYPANPYFTKIQSVDMIGTTMKLVVTRSTTSD